MKIRILNSSELPTEREARKELAAELDCKPGELEVAINQVTRNDGVQVVSFYIQEIGGFDGPAIQIKLPSVEFLPSGIEH